jgi:outer membrane protein OmpA-like peptidoglycan-associated protein
LPALVAPIPKKDRPSKFNTLRPPLVVVGCMKVPNGGFEFDSSFPNPNTERKFTRFAELMKKLRAQDKELLRFPPVTVFGHADPTGDDPYNKVLSGRRARAIYGLLTRNPKIWDELFLNSHGGDKWGMRSIRFMLSKIKDSRVQPPVPFFQGDPESKEKDIDKQTRDAIKQYEEARNLKGGAIGAFPSTATRHAMYLEYMDLICHEEGGKGFVLDAKEHFIAKQKDKDGLRGDVQGCSEFNPVFLLKDEEEKELAKTEEGRKIRNEKYAGNRRVIIYIFKHDTEIDLDTWPCPESRSGVALCQKRFWSDSKKRLARTDEERKFETNRDTMACRFYHGFAEMSPCEKGLRLWIIRFRKDTAKPEPEPLKFRRYVLKAGSTEFAPVIRGTLTEKGELRIPVFDEKAVMTLKLDAFGQEFKFADDPDPAATKAAPAAAGSSGNESTKTEKAEADKNDADPNSGFDTDKFEDEDRFLEIKLDCGALQQVSDTEDFPFKQRLYNLGFGKNPPAEWTQEEFEAAVRAYRHRRPGLGEGPELTKPTRDEIEKEHELTDVPAPVDEDEATAAPAGASTTA